MCRQPQLLTRWMLPAARTLLVLVLMAAAAMPAMAQATDASIIGRVTDESGAALPGVTVTATSPALQVPSVTTVTNDAGEYRLANLPIGVYTVTYELSGFNTVRTEAVRLTVGFIAKLDLVLKVGALEETVTVSGEPPIVDVTSTTTTTQFTKETLEIIPTNRNGINSLLVQAPGTRGTLEAGGSISFNPPNVRTFGQGAEPWYVFEGIYTSSPQSSGGLGNYWDYGSLEEASIQTLGTNAEAPGRGAYITGVVKSGGNEFHGGGYLAYMNSALQSSNIDDELAAQGIVQADRILGRYDVSADFGGRIVRDKLWFYGAFRDRSNKWECIECYGADGVTLAENLQTQRANVSGKLSYQRNASDRFVGFITHNRRFQQSVDRFTPWASRVDSPLWPTIWKIQYQRARANVVFDTQFGHWGYTSPPRATLERGDYSTAPATIDRFTGKISGAPIVQGRSWDYHREHPKATIGWYKPTRWGNHELKAGIDFIMDYGTSPRALRDSPNYQLIFNNGAALQIAAFNSPTTPLQKENYLHAYVQDSWTIMRRVTLNLGLGFNRENPWVPASCREAAAPPADVLFPAQCFDEVQFPILNQVAPRLRAAWDITGNGRTVLKGGWGRYNYKRIIEGDVDISDGQNAVTATYRWRDLNGNRNYDVGEVNWDPNGSDFVSISPSLTTINFKVNPDEVSPKDDEFSLTFEKQLGSTFAVRATGVHSRRSDVFRLTNLLRPPGVYTNPVTRPDPGPDGIVGNTDDPGRTVTYYEYPAALSGRRFEMFTRINDPDATQTYQSFDVSAIRRMADRWMFSFGYSTTLADNPIINGLTPGEFASTAYAAPNDPNSEYLARNHTREWLVHATGAYRLPYEVMVSGGFEGRSGNPYARQVLFTGGVLSSITLRVEDIGTQRLPAVNAFDMRIEKAVKIAARQRVDLRFNLYNVTNINTVRSVTERSGPSFNRPTAIVAPRIAEFSVGYSF